MIDEQDPNVISSEWCRSIEDARREVQQRIKGREVYFDEIQIESMTVKGRLGAYPVALFRAVSRRNLGLLKGE